MNRTNYHSGSHWADLVGYSRAVRIGDVIEVSGTVAADENGQAVGVGDAYSQASFILTKIIAFIERAGGSRHDVIRTRMYVTDISRWEEIGKAHAEFFGNVRPATSMVEVSRLIGPEFLVEIEATAILGMKDEL